MERISQVKCIQTPVRIDFFFKFIESLPCAGYHIGLGDKVPSSCLQGDFSLKGELEKKKRPAFMGLNIGVMEKDGRKLLDEGKLSHCVRGRTKRNKLGQQSWRLGTTRRRWKRIKGERLWGDRGRCDGLWS